MSEVIRHLTKMSHPEAQILAANLELYADRPWPPGLAAALQAQIDALRDAMKRRHQ